MGGEIENKMSQSNAYCAGALGSEHAGFTQTGVFIHLSKIFRIWSYSTGQFVLHDFQREARFSEKVLHAKNHETRKSQTNTPRI